MLPWPVATIRLVVGAERAEDLTDLLPLLSRSATMQIPPLAERADEIDRLIEVYGADAVVVLSAPEFGFRPDDVKRVRASGVSTHDEFEDVARRLVALRNWGVAAGRSGSGSPMVRSRAGRGGRIPT